MRLKGKIIMNVNWKIIYNLIFLCKIVFLWKPNKRKYNKNNFFSYIVDYKQFAHLELPITCWVIFTGKWIKLAND